MTPAMLAIAAAAAAGFIFIALAVTHARHFATRDEFLFAQRLSSGRVASNISATASSLAGPFAFFLLQAPTYAWILLTLVPLNLLGYLIFGRMVESLDVSPQHTGSIYRLVRWKTGSASLAAWCNVVVVINFFLIFLIELVLGAWVIEHFIPNTAWASTASVFILGAVALIYITVGGFRIVAVTDTWQFILVAIGLGVSLVTTMVLVLRGPSTVGSIVGVFASPQGTPWLLATFVANTLATNLTQASVQVSSWQRFASSGDQRTFRAGLLRAVTAQYGWVWLVAILMSATLAAGNADLTSLNGVFAFLEQSSWFSAYVAFPLLFVGLIAALISTADSMLIALMLALADFSLKSPLSATPTTSRSLASASHSQTQLLRQFLAWPQVQFFVLGVTMVAMATLAFWLIENVTGGWRVRMLQLMFAGYGQTALLFPLLFMLSRRTITRPLVARRAVVVSLASYWAAISYGLFTSDVGWNQLAPAIAVVVCGVGCGAVPELWRSLWQHLRTWFQRKGRA